MTVLLDTCTFLWMATDEKQLSPTAMAVLADPTNRRLLSAISVLEISIKTRIGKLKLNGSVEQVVRLGMLKGVIGPFPVSIEHSLAVANLPLHHRDPFDRLIVGQAMAEGIPVVTNDVEIRKYAVQIIW